LGDSQPPDELGSFPYSQSVTIPLSGTFSGDSSRSRVTVSIPQGSLQNQSLSLPPINVQKDIGGVGLVTGSFQLSGLVLSSLSSAIVYENTPSQPVCGNGVCDQGETQATCPADCAPPQDSDGDGVPDSADLCPGTPANTMVDADGCPPQDSDGDGV